MSEKNFTHINSEGDALMVDVAGREVTARYAIASGKVFLTQKVVAMLRDGSVPKGDVLSTARIAGIMGAKKTSELIPLCHPLAIHGVTLKLSVVDDGVEITSEVKTVDRTGVEMEALTCVSVAGLTVIDMIKSIDPSATLSEIKLIKKDGGRNGLWERT